MRGGPKVRISVSLFQSLGRVYAFDGVGALSALQGLVMGKIVGLKDCGSECVTTNENDQRHKYHVAHVAHVAQLSVI